MVVKLDANSCKKIGGMPINGKCKLAKILVGKKPNRTDSFFYYDEDEIASFKGKKNAYSLISSGDIRIEIDDESYTKRDLDDAIEKYKLTDKKLRSLEDKERLEWLNNNWFEVEFKPKNSEYWQSVMGDVAYDYDGAIRLLEGAIVKKELGK